MRVFKYKEIETPRKGTVRYSFGIVYYSGIYAKEFYFKLGKQVLAIQFPR